MLARQFTTQYSFRTSCFAHLRPFVYCELVEAWSGMGMVRNYGDPQPVSKVPLPVYALRTIASDSSSVWNFTNYIPDAGTRASLRLVSFNCLCAVVINLGTNDYSTEPHPSDDQFITGYVTFVSMLQHQWPQMKVFAVCGPMISGVVCLSC